jgi:hypothetical protein
VEGPLQPPAVDVSAGRPAVAHLHPVGEGGEVLGDHDPERGVDRVAVPVLIVVLALVSRAPDVFRTPSVFRGRALGTYGRILCWEGLAEGAPCEQKRSHKHQGQGQLWSLVGRMSVGHIHVE